MLTRRISETGDGIISGSLSSDLDVNGFQVISTSDGDIDINPNGTGSVTIPADNTKLYFGAGDDASITYDGTDLVVDSQEVGSGDLIINSGGGNVGVGQGTPSSDNSTTTFLHIGSSSSGAAGLVLEDDENQWELLTNGALSIYDGGTERLNINASTGAFTVTGDINPEADGTRDLGTQTTAQWANVWSDLINGADISLLNGWRMLELEKYDGYPKGFALGNTHFKTGVVEEKMPADAKPVLAVTDDFIEFKGRRLSLDMLDKILELIGT